MRGAHTIRAYVLLGAAFAALAFLIVLLVPSQVSVKAQTAPSVAAGIASGRVAASLPAEGGYFANDDFKFTIVRKHGVMLMRFVGDDEVFVLSVERGPVGGRVLKYDTGDVAIQVTGYGAVTLYTSTAPGGLPAERMDTGDAIAFPVPPMSALRLQAQLFSDRLRQTGLNVRFTADWSRLDEGAARYLALDTMRNAARALGGICANRADQAELAARLREVRVIRGERAGAIYRSGVFILTFAPVYGLRGRLSSLAIARAVRVWL